VGKKNKKKEDLWRKASELANSFNLGEESSQQSWSWGIHDVRENSKLRHSPHKFEQWIFMG